MGIRFVTVKCDHEDGGGCGTRWMETGWVRIDSCPRCGGPTTDGHIVVNDGDAPDVSGLDRDDVMVVYGGVES